MSLAKRVGDLEERVGGLPRGCQCNAEYADISVVMADPMPPKSERPAITIEICPRCGKEREVQNIYITVNGDQERPA